MTPRHKKQPGPSVSRPRKDRASWRCRLGWHRPRMTGFDGCSIHAVCERCGYTGMLDSYGQLF